MIKDKNITRHKYGKTFLNGYVISMSRQLHSRKIAALMEFGLGLGLGIGLGLNLQKQPPEVLFKKNCSQKFCNIHRKTPMGSLFSNVEKGIPGKRGRGRWKDPGPRLLWWPRILWRPRTLGGLRILWGPRTLGWSRLLGRPTTLWGPRIQGGPRTLQGSRILWGLRTLREPKTRIIPCIKYSVWLKYSEILYFI